MVELEHSKDAAEAANRAKSTFLANMSHEFRTPLNAILGFTQIMARDKRLPVDHKQDIEIIHRSGEHLLGLINDVLDMSKIEAGRTRLNQRGFDLTRMLEGLEEMFALRAEQKGLALSLDLGPGVPRYVTADDGKLRQVLMNLLGNAVKFTDQGQVVLRVHTASPPTAKDRRPACGCASKSRTPAPASPPARSSRFSCPSSSRARGNWRRRAPGWDWRSASNTCG